MPTSSHDTPAQWGIPVGTPPPRPTLLWVLVAVSIGISFDRWTSAWPIEVGWRVVIWGGLASLATMAWWIAQRRGWLFTSSIVLMIGCVGLAGAWHTYCWKAYAADEISRYAPKESEPCCLEVITTSHVERVASVPRSPYRAIPTGEKSHVEVEVVRLRNGRQWQAASGKCQLWIDGHLLGVGPRDLLRVHCQIQATQPASNPGDFDYRLYARADRQLCSLYCSSPECVSVVQRGSDWEPRAIVARWNGTGQDRLWSRLGPRVGPVACAIILGADHALPTERRTHYLATGATHVLVVSGLHASILVSGVLLLLRGGFLPRRTSLLIAMLLIVVYTLLTGANPPVVRAAVVAEIMCVGLWMGRAAISFNSLAAAGLVVLALNPCELFLTGTQLSFLCTATLLWIASVVRAWPRTDTPADQLAHLSEPWMWQASRLVRRYLGMSLLTSGFIWLVTLPLVAMQFHIYSLVSVPASLLVLPLASLSLMVGMLYLLVASLIPWCESWIAPICVGVFESLDGAIHWFSTWPLSHAWTAGPAAWWVAGYYVLLALLLKQGGIRGGWPRLARVMAAWVLVGAAVPMIARCWPRELEIAFLDVGHGTSVVVTTPEGVTLLYDAGGLGSPRQATNSISNYLWSRGIRKIDGVILSHADVDHFSGLPGLLERFPIGRVFVSPQMFPATADPEDDSAPAMLRRALIEHQIPIEVVMMGDRLTIDTSTVAEVLYPDELGNVDGDNANSLVIGLEHQGLRVLLPGDIEGFGMKAVLADTPYDCHILLAPHHGSNRSDPPGFAAWSTPEWVVISGAPEFSDPTVAATYRSSGSKVFATGERGAVIFRFLEGDLNLPDSTRLAIPTQR